MNKNAIKKFAIAARKRLIATVSDRAGMLGITKDEISQPVQKGSGFEIYKTSAGTENTLNSNQIAQRRKLVAEIESHGFDVVMEEVAYTWFNRICAIRFMEVNNYLPTRVRVLSSERPGKNEPDLLTEAPDVDLDFTDEERDWILTEKETNKLDELFSWLFIRQCNKLSEILPKLFEETEDYTEMLLSLSYTNKDDVVRMLVDGIDDKDFNIHTLDENGNPTGQVEIIGWLYQYYNTELKDDTFAKLKKNVKISKERIPAATQLFTPDWIVRYMVENSVGRVWIEYLRAVDPSTDEKTTAERFGWKYYLPEAKQEPEVDAKLAEIRESYKDLKPEDILCIDPCMGSGHIIVAQFDVMMDIYRSVGYGERDAAFEIVEHNLHGLDIDKRAYQLTYFAVMMKGRQYNRRFFRGRDGARPQPKVYAFVESNDINRAQLKYFGAELNEFEKNNALNQMNGLLDTFIDAREYGSILNVENYDWALLRRFTEHIDDQGQLGFEQVGLDQTQETIKKIIDIGEVMATKYHAVVTNPPYMGITNGSKRLLNYVKENYKGNKIDLFSVFMEKTIDFLISNGFCSLITQQTWMFISSFVKTRRMLNQYLLVNLCHLGTRAFEDIGGEVVQSASYVLQKVKSDNYISSFIKLDDTNEKCKEFTNAERIFFKRIHDFNQIPDGIYGYWLSNSIINSFSKYPPASKYVDGKIGLQTGDNNKFLRLWFEVNQNNMSTSGLHDNKYWVPYNKAGSYRRWYGNNDYVVNWKNDGHAIINCRDDKGRLKSRPQNKEYYFREGITWSDVSTGLFSMRKMPSKFIFDSCAPSAFGKDIYYLLGLYNTSVAQKYLDFLAPTIHYTCGQVLKMPVIKSDTVNISLIKENVQLSKYDWDSFETSWDFQTHPFVRYSRGMWDATATAAALDKYYGRNIKPESPLETCYLLWQGECQDRFDQLKANEEELNRIFIDIYGLQDELTPEEEDKDVTVRKADLGRDVRSFISYAVGCMFGRYSFDVDGLAYAGGEWDSSKYKTFIPDKDNIIPITDEEYFEDDIVGLFCNLLKKVYGEDTLEENLDFIAKALGNKGDTSRDVLRNYFLHDFFKDHCNTYSVTGSGKRPIYWLFDSGKQNGFKALIYMHRYDPDTVGRVRTDYLHKTQKAIEQAMASAQYTLENSRSGSEKSKATKRISKYTKQLAEIQLYDEAIVHVASQRIPLDLDDGVKVNYAKFQGVEVSREGMKTVKVDLLAKI